MYLVVSSQKMPDGVYSAVWENHITTEHFRYASRSAPVDGVLLIDMHLDTGVDDCLPASWLLPWIVEARITHLWHLVPMQSAHMLGLTHQDRERTISLILDHEDGDVIGCRLAPDTPALLVGILALSLPNLTLESGASSPCYSTHVVTWHQQAFTGHQQLELPDWFSQSGDWKLQICVDVDAFGPTVEPTVQNIPVEIRSDVQRLFNPGPVGCHRLLYHIVKCLPRIVASFGRKRSSELFVCECHRAAGMSDEFVHSIYGAIGPLCHSRIYIEEVAYACVQGTIGYFDSDLLVRAVELLRRLLCTRRVQHINFCMSPQWMMHWEGIHGMVRGLCGTPLLAPSPSVSDNMLVIVADCMTHVRRAVEQAVLVYPDWHVMLVVHHSPPDQLSSLASMDEIMSSYRPSVNVSFRDSVSPVDDAFAVMGLHDTVVVCNALAEVTLDDYISVIRFIDSGCVWGLSLNDRPGGFMASRCLAVGVTFADVCFESSPFLFTQDFEAAQDVEGFLLPIT